MNSVQPAVAGGLLRDAALMLGVALIFVTAFRRLRLGATLGYIVAGALIGPSVFGFFRDPEAIQRVSEIGIALLLFIVGIAGFFASQITATTSRRPASPAAWRRRSTPR